MNLENIQDRIVQVDTSLIACLKKMDDKHVKLLFVFERECFLGILTIGDIQRAIIRNIDLLSPVKAHLEKNKQYACVGDSLEQIKAKVLSLRAECMPVIDEEGNLVAVHFWEDFFGFKEREDRQSINLPVVIMAGGKGTRLKPLTNIYPKPLIPIGEKTIVESIMDKFVSYDCHNFYLSVNYKADAIKNYFSFVANPNYELNYFQEDKPMGTAGSLRMLKNKICSTFFVSNCDILINEDYALILDYHRQNHNELTVVASLMTYSIPYGTIITGENGLLRKIEEKPSLTFKINTGFYILEPSLLNDIPDDFFHITHLIDKLTNEGRRVGVYPISQNDWTDMGDWKEYLKMIKL